MRYKTEAKFSKALLRWAKGRDDIILISHEDKYTPGIADLSFASPWAYGWLELKLARVTRDGIVIPKLTKAQRDYLIAHGQMGMCCYVMSWTDANDIRLTSWRDLHDISGERDIRLPSIATVTAFDNLPTSLSILR